MHDIASNVKVNTVQVKVVINTIKANAYMKMNVRLKLMGQG